MALTAGEEIEPKRRISTAASRTSLSKVPQAAKVSRGGRVRQVKLNLGCAHTRIKRKAACV